MPDVEYNIRKTWRKLDDPFSRIAIHSPDMNNPLSRIAIRSLDFNIQ